MDRIPSDTQNAELPHLIIVGFQFAGYNLLQQVKHKLKVTVIDKKEFFEWTPGTQHSIANEGNFEENSYSYYQAINIDKVFGENVSFYQGLLDELVDDHTINVKPTKGKSSSEISSIEAEPLTFDYLALCTGYLWSINDAPEDAFHIYSQKDRSAFLTKYREEVDNAKSILVVGGGSIGVETVAELLEKYQDQKKIGIVAHGETLVDYYPQEIQEAASSHFEKKGVNIHLNTKFDSSSTLKDEYDYVMYWARVRIMTSYMDKNYKDFKNKKGSIFVNDFYQITTKDPLGSDTPLEEKTLKNVFWFGDASLTRMNEPKNLPALVYASQIVSYNLLMMAEGKDESEFRSMPEKNIFISDVYFDHNHGAEAVGDLVTDNPNAFADKKKYEEPIISFLKKEPEGQKTYDDFLEMFKA